MTNFNEAIARKLDPIIHLAKEWEIETRKEIAYLQGQLATAKLEKANIAVELAALKGRDSLLIENERLRRKLEDEHTASVGCTCRTDGFYHIEFLLPTYREWRQSINDRRKFASADDAEFVVKHMRKEFPNTEYRVVGPGYVGHSIGGPF